MQDRDIITELSHELYKTTWSPITSSGGRNHKIITVIIDNIIDKYINITVYKTVLQPQLNCVYKSGSLQSNLLILSVIRMWKLDSISTTHQGAGSLPYPMPPEYPRYSLVAQENTYRNTWQCQNRTHQATSAAKTTSVAGSRYTYAIQSSSTSSILWRTATR